MSNNYNFSFIIPHKNIPDLLIRCVKSIPRREDVQIIIVDDNSDPNIVDFDNFPFAGEKNIEVYFDKTGNGAGHARNVGIEHATGKWLVFTDADDYYNYCIYDALDDYKNTDADIVFFKASSVYEETYLPSDRANRINKCVDLFLSRDREGDYSLRYVHSCPVSKFISRELVLKNKISFEEIPKHNDSRFAYTSGYYAKKIVAVNKAIYCITTRNGSISTILTPEAKLLRIHVYSEWLEFRFRHKIEALNDEVLFNTLAELFFEDKSSFYKGLKDISSKGLSDDYISNNIQIAIFKYRIRHILSPKIRKKIRKILRMK
jgi:glycosyltransferase involved in cell wall biosynthesis